MKKKKVTRQDLINFFNENHRAPCNMETQLYQMMWRLCKNGDAEIIALKKKYEENTKEFTAANMSAARKRAGETRKQQLEEKREERVVKIRERHNETGKWPASNSPDYDFIIDTKSISPAVALLWEDMHKPEENREPVETFSTDTKTKTVSELTLSEIPSFLRLIGNKTISELIAKPERPEEPEKVDISKIETTLSEDTIRTIINPEKEVVVTNPKWEKAKDVLEYLFADDSLKRHFAYEMLLESPVFAQEVAKLVRDNPKKTFCHKDKIVERMINSIPADRYYLLNPANIQDLVKNCF